MWCIHWVKLYPLEKPRNVLNLCSGGGLGEGVEINRGWFSSGAIAGDEIRGKRGTEGYLYEQALSVLVQTSEAS